MSILIREDINHVAHLTMNAPKSLNALSDEMLAALQDQLDQIKDDPDIRVVVLSGAGKGFCAGHDLKQMQAGRQSEDGGNAYFGDLFDRCSKLMLSIRALPQPVVAKVHGIATAAGCQLVATCDLAIAADDTKFGVNGVNIGLFCSTPMVALTRNVAPKTAFEMLTTGQFMSADDACKHGLINRAVPEKQLSVEIETLTSTLASKLKAVVNLGKQAFYAQIEMPVEDAYAYTRNVMTNNLKMKDTDEGMTAFIEKRPPNWSK